MTDHHDETDHPNEGNPPAFPPLSEDDIPHHDGPSGLPIGELIGVTESANAVIAALGPTMADLFQSRNFHLDVEDISLTARTAAALQAALPPVPLPDFGIRETTLQAVNDALGGAAAAGLNFGHLFRQLDAFPDLSSQLHALDDLPDTTVSIPDYALTALEEPARQFAATEGKGMSWEMQQCIFAGAVAAVVLFLLLQAMVSSDAFKELTGDVGTVSGLVLFTYLASKSGWARLYPKPSTDEE